MQNFIDQVDTALQQYNLPELFAFVIFIIVLVGAFKLLNKLV